VKRTVIAIVSFLVGCSLIYWAFAPDDWSYASQAGVARAKAHAAAQLQIERLRKPSDGPVDWPAVAAQFEITLPLVREIDKAHPRLHYEHDIARALEKCTVGSRPDVNEQTLAKGLQHVTVLAIRGELETIARATGPDRHAAAIRITALFEGIRPTFTRRDSDFFPAAPALTPAADDALKQLAAAAASEQHDVVGPGRRLEDALCRTYALSVLYEIVAIEKLRSADRPACDVKRAEALIFYRIIADRVKKRDPNADQAIGVILTADYDKMDAFALENALTRGLPKVPLR